MQKAQIWQIYLCYLLLKLMLIFELGKYSPVPSSPELRIGDDDRLESCVLKRLTFKSEGARDRRRVGRAGASRSKVKLKIIQNNRIKRWNSN